MWLLVEGCLFHRFGITQVNFPLTWDRKQPSQHKYRRHPTPTLPSGLPSELASFIESGWTSSFSCVLQSDYPDLELHFRELTRIEAQYRSQRNLWDLLRD